MSLGDIFPQEIIDAFIEFLSTDPPDRYLDSRYALASCALVSKSFSGPARRHLFSTIQLTPHKVFSSSPSTKRPYSQQELLQRIQVLAELLSQGTSDSDLILLIRTLHVNIDDARAMLKSTSSLNVVLSLVNSRAFNLETFHFAGHFLPWTIIPMDIIQSLANICRSESIRNLHFSNITALPTNLISDFPSLLSLHLRDVRFSDSANISCSSKTKTTSAHPVYLHLESCLSEFWDHSSHMSPIISKIKGLTMSIVGDKDSSAFFNILRRGSDTLISLDVTFHAKNIIYLTVDLSLLPSLRKIFFRLRHATVTATQLITFLNNVTMPTQIESITLDADLRVSQDLDKFLPAQGEGLRPLGLSVLENKSSFLQKIVINLLFYFNYVSLKGPDGIQLLTPSDVHEMERSIQSRILSFIVPPTSSQYDSLIRNIEVTVGFPGLRRLLKTLFPAYYIDI